MAKNSMTRLVSLKKKKKAADVHIVCKICHFIRANVGFC